MNEKLIEWFDNDEQNQALLKLYESKNYKEVIAEIVETNERTGGKELVLHLPCVTENYQKMDKKIMVIGQELDGWKEIKDNPRDAMIALLESQYKQTKKRPFFVFSFSFCKKMNSNIKLNKKIKASYVVWANIRKFSYNKDCPKSKAPRKPLNEEAQKLIYEKFNFLKEEIKIINPDIVLFLTGPDYDNYIEDQLDGVKFNKLENSEYEKREFARVEHEVLPKKSFRIYHPNAFRQGSVIKKLGKNHLYKEFLKILVEECKK